MLWRQGDPPQFCWTKRQKDVSPSMLLYQMIVGQKCEKEVEKIVKYQNLNRAEKALVAEKG